MSGYAVVSRKPSRVWSEQPTLDSQTPPMHCAPGPQTLPQVPQLFGSVETFVQVVELHSCAGAVQLTPHLPAAQTWPVGHTVPHLPQLLPSVCSLVHALPQKF
jgi:hypothetical protein